MTDALDLFDGEGYSDDSEEEEKSPDVEAIVPDLVTHLTAEESDGKFRRLQPSSDRIARRYYAEKTKRRFEYANPVISAPGNRYYVLLGNSLDDGIVIANGYTRVAGSAHGDYVEISPSQLAIDTKEFTRQRDSKLTAEYRWICLRYLGHCVYYAGDSLTPKAAEVMSKPTPVSVTEDRHNPDGQTLLTRYFSGKSTAPVIKSTKKPAGPHIHNEFSRNMFYVPTTDSFAVESSEYETRKRSLESTSSSIPKTRRK